MKRKITEFRVVKSNDKYFAQVEISTTKERTLWEKILRKPEHKSIKRFVDIKDFDDRYKLQDHGLITKKEMSLLSRLESKCERMTDGDNHTQKDMAKIIQQLNFGDNQNTFEVIMDKNMVAKDMPLPEYMQHLKQQTTKNKK